MILNEGEPDSVKNNILSELKIFCEDQMGIKLVDEQYLTKTVKDIACGK